MDKKIIYLLSFILIISFLPNALAINPVLWNRMEGVASDIGPNGVWTGTPAYAAAKFNNGADMDASNYMNFASAVPLQNGTFEAWLKPHADSSNQYVVFWTPSSDIFLACNGGSTIYGLGGGVTEYAWTLSFDTNEIFNLAYTWDGSASAGERLKLYKNGVLLAPSSILSDSAWASSGYTDLNFNQTGYTPNMIIDNVKIYDHVKTIFPDIWYEDGNILYPNLIFWNTLDNDTEIANSRIGAGGTPSSPLTYSPAVFMNGVNNIGQTNSINFAQSVNDSLITVQGWLNFSSANPYTAIFYANNGVDGMYWYRYNDGNMYFDTTDYSCYFAQSTDSGYFHHYATVINGSESAGNRIKIYVDNIRQTTTCRWDAAGVGRAYAYFKLGLAGASNDAAFDNFRLYNKVKYGFEDALYEDGNILYPGLMLWNKLDNDSKVTHSEVGVNFAWVGTPAYTPMQFHDGVYVIDESNYPSTRLNGFHIQENGTIEMWIKPIGWSMTNGITSGGDYNYPWSLSSGNGYTYFGPDGGSSSMLGATTQLTHISLANGVLSHLAFVWAKNGINGTTDTYRVYQDGILRENTTATLTPTGASFTGEGFGLGHKMFTDQNWALEGGIDNVKWFNYAKTNFSDRFFENGSAPVPPTPPSGNASFNFSIIHRQDESICIGWGTPPFYDFPPAGNLSSSVLWASILGKPNFTDTYVPYMGAVKNVNLSDKNFTLSGAINWPESSGIYTLFYVNQLLTDGFAFDYYYNFEAANDDWAVFKKTDGNDPTPDGGIAFMMANTTNEWSILKLDGYKHANFTDYNIMTSANVTGKNLCYGNGKNSTGGDCSTDAYGGMYNFSDTGHTITILSSGDYYNITGLECGLYNGIICNVSSSELVILVGGVYKVDFSVSLSTSSGNGEYGIGVAKNHINLETQKKCYARDYLTSNEVRAVSGSCFLSLSAGETLGLMIDDEASPTRSIKWQTIDMMVVRMS